MLLLDRALDELDEARRELPPAGNLVFPVGQGAAKRDASGLTDEQF